MNRIPHQPRRGAVAAAIGIVAYLLACGPSPSGPFDPPEDEPVTEEELDEREYDELGCLGAYEYDPERNCRKPTRALCQYETVAGCQSTDQRDAYDVDGTCWHFNRCIPNGNFWPAEPGDVCNHDRAAVPPCGEEEEFYCSRILSENACDRDERCKPRYGYDWDDTASCVDYGDAVFTDCVATETEEDEDSVAGLVATGGGCYWVEHAIRTECDDWEYADENPGECPDCPEPSSPESCLTETADLGIVTWQVTNTPDPVALDEEPSDGPEPCIPAALGSPKFRDGSDLVDDPPTNRDSVQVLIPVRNDVDGSTCGFSGQELRMRLEGTMEPSEQVGYWPTDLPCNGEAYLAATFDTPAVEQDFELTVAMTDSCGSGGGALTYEFTVDG